jgi:hypothetical protein
MKKAIPEHVDFQIHDIIRRILCRKHIMCLEDLMKKDAIQKAAHPDT